jgi:hypothetical protein
VGIRARPRALAVIQFRRAWLSLGRWEQWSRLWGDMLRWLIQRVGRRSRASRSPIAAAHWTSTTAGSKRSPAAVTARIAGPDGQATGRR